MLQRPRLLIGVIMAALVVLGLGLAITAAQIATSIDASVLAEEHGRAATTAAAYSERFGPLQPDAVTELGVLLSLADLRIVGSGVEPGPGETRMELLDGQGPPGSALIWRPHLYGAEAYANFAPKRLPVGAVALISLILMLYYLYRIAGDLERRRRDANDLAGRDPLTGLANRLGLDTALRSRFATLRRPFALFCLDLDGFKSVNDRFGHGAGDFVLQTVGVRLRQILGQDAIVGRLGGDEFVVLLDGGLSREALEALGHRMRASISSPFAIGGIKARVGVSIGIAEAPTQASSPEALVAIADAALYRAKSGQGLGVCIGSVGERPPPSETPTHNHRSAA